MAEFYQEKLMLKIEVIDGENLFGILKVSPQLFNHFQSTFSFRFLQIIVVFHFLICLQNWRRRFVQFETVKVNGGLMRINFFYTEQSKQPIASILLNPSSNFRIKRGITVTGDRWYVLGISWQDSEGAVCQLSLAFESETKYKIHRNIIESLVKNLLEFRKISKGKSAPIKDCAHFKCDWKDREHEILETEVKELCANNYSGKTSHRMDGKSDTMDLYHEHEIHFMVRKHPDADAGRRNRRVLSLKKCLRKLGLMK